MIPKSSLFCRELLFSIYIGTVSIDVCRNTDRYYLDEDRITGEQHQMRDVWDALNDQTRRGILSLLKNRPHTAGELGDQFNLSAATVSHHLRVLKESGLICGEKRGQTIIYTLDGETAKRTLHSLAEILQ